MHFSLTFHRFLQVSLTDTIYCNNTVNLYTCALHFSVRVGGRMERGIVFTRFILVYLTPIAFCILFAAAGTDPPVRCLYVAGIMGM